MRNQAECCSSVRFATRPNSQRGAALIVGLVLLLILTMIGVAGMRDTLLQERMAGSSRDRQLALQAAEAALRAAETKIANADAYDAGSIGAVKRIATDFPRTIDSLTVNEAGYWNDSDSWVGSTSYTGISGLSAKPEYVIERMPCSYSKAPKTWNSAPNLLDVRVTDYRVTAKAQGLTENVTVILQSVFRRTDKVATSTDVDACDKD